MPSTMKKLDKDAYGISPLLREKHIVPDLVPVSRGEWWNGIKAGRYPQPIKLSAKVTCWRAEDIKALVEGRFVPVQVEA